MQVTLQQGVDLTAAANQPALQTTAQELTGDWLGYQQRTHLSPVSAPVGLAPTQELGQALHAVAGLEGMRTLSAKVPTHRILVIFPDKLQAGSSVVFHHPSTGQTWTIHPPKPRTKRAKP